MKDELVIITYRGVPAEIVPIGPGGTQVVKVSRRIFSRIEIHLQPYISSCKLLGDRGIENLYCRRSVLAANQGSGICLI